MSSVSQVRDTLMNVQLGGTLYSLRIRPHSVAALFSDFSRYGMLCSCDRRAHWTKTRTSLRRSSLRSTAGISGDMRRFRSTAWP